MLAQGSRALLGEGKISLKKLFLLVALLERQKPNSLFRWFPNCERTTETSQVSQRNLQRKAALHHV